MKKLAFITGAAKRIGREIALSLAQQGWAVAIHYHHSEEEATATYEEIKRCGVPAMKIQADLMEEVQVAAMIPRINQELGAITCLINNAAAFVNDTLAKQSRASFDLHLETNLRAPLSLTQQFAAQLPAGEPGNVINILDYCVWKLPEKKFFSYGISKAALWAATQMLALELAPLIRVNAIGPGLALPNTNQNLAMFEAMNLSSPLQHGTNPEEICQAVHFLLNAPSVTGQMIALDSGRHLANQGYF